MSHQLRFRCDPVSLFTVIGWTRGKNKTKNGSKWKTPLEFCTLPWFIFKYIFMFSASCPCLTSHRIHGTGIFTYIWLIFVVNDVNVGKYTTHGSYGLPISLSLEVTTFHLSFSPSLPSEKTWICGWPAKLCWAWTRASWVMDPSKRTKGKRCDFNSSKRHRADMWWKWSLLMMYGMYLVKLKIILTYSPK